MAGTAKITLGQFKTLSALADAPAGLPTSNVTVKGQTVSGTASAALDKRGFVSRRTKDGVTTVKINADGKRALKVLAASV